MKKPKFMIAFERKTVMHRGVLPVKVLEFYLISDTELKPSNINKKSTKRSLYANI